MSTQEWTPLSTSGLHFSTVTVSLCSTITHAFDGGGLTDESGVSPRYGRQRKSEWGWLSTSHRAGNFSSSCPLRVLPTALLSRKYQHTIRRLLRVLAKSWWILDLSRLTGYQLPSTRTPTLHANSSTRDGEHN